MSTKEFNKYLLEVTPNLESFAYSLTNDVDKAADLYQDTALRAIKNKDKFRVGTNFKAWVMTMMKNIFINNYRMRRRRATHSEPTGSYTLEVASGVTDNQGISNLTLDEIMTHMDALDNQYREPFLRYYNGYSYQEIADDLGKPLGTIKSRIHHARKRMQASIGPRLKDAA